MSTAIRTTNLTKQYDNQTVVNQVNLEVKQGCIYGLLGRNGAGKTTIMKMMMGLVKPSSGEIEILGEKIGASTKDRKRLYSRIGAMIETPGYYPNLTGTENMNIFAKLRGTVSRNAVKEALDIVGLPYKDKKLFANYSLGMKQRLGIANAIMHDPELLILDEPTNGLDPIGIAEMRDLIKKMSTLTGKTIFISSHILSEIALLADDIGIIHNGILLTESSYAELEKNNSKYFLLKVSSSAQAARILEQKLGLFHYSVDDDYTIRLFDTKTDIAQINKALMLSDIDVNTSQLCNDTLEDYFRKITGGEGIA